MLAKSATKTCLKVISIYDNRRKPNWFTPIFAKAGKGNRMTIKKKQGKNQDCSSEGVISEETSATVFQRFKESKKCRIGARLQLMPR